MVVNKGIMLLFKQILSQCPFSFQTYSISGFILEEQARLLNLAYYALEQNIAPEEIPNVLGGKVDENAISLHIQQLNQIIELKIKSEESQNQLKGLVPEYIEALGDQIRSTCAIRLVVDDLPFREVNFCTLPYIDFTQNSGKNFIVKNKGFSLSGIIDAVIAHPTMLVVAYQNALKTGGTDLFFAPLKRKLNLPTCFSSSPQNFSRFVNGQHPLQMNLDFLHGFRQIPSKDPCFDDIWVFDQDQQREGNPFAAFLNADFILFESLTKLGYRKVYDFEESPYSIAGILDPHEEESVFLLYNFQEYEFPNISATLNALCQLGAATLEYPRLNPS